jgi:uncharacterized protein (DUF1330 family)
MLASPSLSLGPGTSAGGAVHRRRSTVDLFLPGKDTEARPRRLHLSLGKSHEMTAYLIAQLTITDPAGFDAYRQVVPPVIAAHGGRYLARGGAVTRLEGEPGGPRIIVLEFADKAAAEGFYNSPEYQKILPLRLRAASGSVFIVEGCL